VMMLYCFEEWASRWLDVRDPVTEGHHG
jgi:hypothetical protein